MNTKKLKEAENTSRIGSTRPATNGRLYTELDSNGLLVSRALTTYECQLEDDVEQLQEALFMISSQYAKIQFRLRQISSASASERIFLLKELEGMATQGLDGRDSRQVDELPSLRCDSNTLGNVRVRQRRIISQLRERLEDLADATGACFQAETNECSNANPTDQGAGVTCNIKGKQARERYLEETWPGGDYDKPDMQGLNSKWKLKALRGRPKNRKKKERSERKCAVHECNSDANFKTIRYHSQELKKGDNLLNLRKNKLEQK